MMFFLKYLNVEMFVYIIDIVSYWKVGLVYLIWNNVLKNDFCCDNLFLFYLIFKIKILCFLIKFFK